ncbi:MAG TPA: LysM peptidoglycan-binding domain-containing protein [Anaerolineales bacterium]
MKANNLFKSYLMLSLLAGFVTLPGGVRAAQSEPLSIRAAGATAYDLIVAMNSLRVSNGLPALVEDSIIDAVAQSTAQIMADNQMSWHIGNVSGRLASAGYGGGSTVWATENFAIGNQTIDEIMLVWSDPSHMLPAVTAAYCNVGAGVARASNGMTYYVLQAAYTAGKSCGEYTSSGPTTPKTGSTTYTGVSQLIMPVKIATPDADGKVFHVVQAGQSFWSIAIAYKITIKDLKSWNNLTESSTLKIGEKLFIPNSNTAGYATPTQPGSVQVSAPDEVGRVIHVVAPYQTLSTIATAYGTTVEKILALNGLRVDWSLQIGQKLVINAGNVTPSATLHPIQLLTPASDGKYYHVIKSGETLSWIAGVYGVSVSELMAWNGLTDASMIKADQKLLLLVTPPATVTPTPAPPTPTPTVTITPLPPTATTVSATPTSAPTSFIENVPLLPIGAVFLLVAGLGLGAFIYLRKINQS